MLYEKLPLMSGHFANVKARLIFQLPFFVFMQHRMHPRAKRELKIKKKTLWGLNQPPTTLYLLSNWNLLWLLLQISKTKRLKNICLCFVSIRSTSIQPVFLEQRFLLFDLLISLIKWFKTSDFSKQVFPVMTLHLKTFSNILYLSISHIQVIKHRLHKSNLFSLITKRKENPIQKWKTTLNFSQGREGMGPWESGENGFWHFGTPRFEYATSVHALRLLSIPPYFNFPTWHELESWTGHCP